ncbi:Type III restriction enzyme, res subunit [Novipirellula artificiosorum]|uniref:Type III restriction enzyme, res subunit n=2 Tax=Novipirellula artificiosorum TaxID=2528016 RepID=A0A5C6E3P1_9BACT|nr:Type III restriction enzyme, res subunit [Novipirellula artificiosorum]
MPEIRFAGQLRPSQKEVVEVASRQLNAGQRRLHIVAPPGSGKTVIGLYIWAELVGTPALVLSPNSAIQAQWVTRTDLFKHRSVDDLQSLISTSADFPGRLTSLTYQSVTMPARSTEWDQQRAIDLWTQTLLEKDQAQDATEAEVWIDDLRRHNPEYFNERLSGYRKRIRDDDAIGGLAMSLLHRSCIDTLVRLRETGVGLLILDECHHLMGHWGRVLSEASEYLGDPIIVGLTATPPDRSNRKQEDIKRYDRFFGPIDYDVPVPAVVKDGFLAPYQDLAYFVRPTEKELDFIAGVDNQFASLLDQLCSPPLGESPSSRESLIDWLVRVLRDKQLPVGQAADWRSFYVRDREFAESAVAFLQSRSIEIPADVPPPLQVESVSMDQWGTLIDRYTRHYLRRSPHPEDHRMAEVAVDRLRMLGVQITETGIRACASPVSRVIAYTRSKSAAVAKLLRREMEILGDETRAVVIADYEKSSAISADVADVLDAEAGGAVAAFRTLVDDMQTNDLDPVLITGSTVLVDGDLVHRIMRDAASWLQRRSIEVELNETRQGNFYEINGRGSDWCPRVYVEMITELFQHGVTRCLVGTRGLLGEGWDANTVNVLIDLSTVTTSMTVKQLRGRSLRLNPNEPRKVANNWDIVCIAPEHTNGLADYHRFIKKHETIFGICDDGAIEKGGGHVHAAFTTQRPEWVDGNVDELNHDMMDRAARRDEIYNLWRIGKPYNAEPVHAIEVASRRPNLTLGYPPFQGSRSAWDLQSIVLAISRSVLLALRENQMIGSESILRVAIRDGGYVRVFLERAIPSDAKIFATAVRETLCPIDQPRYLIPRSVDIPVDTMVRRWLPNFISRFFERRIRKTAMLHAVPSCLATRRELVAVFQRHWNANVSPGEAVFVKNEKGEQMLATAIRDDLTPTTLVHEKELFF